MKKAIQEREYYPITIPQTNFIAEKLLLPTRKIEQDVLSFYFLVKRDANEDIMEKAFNRLIYENDGLRLRFEKSLFPLKIRQYIEDYEYEVLERITVRDWTACEEKMHELQNTMQISARNHEKQYCAVIISFDKGIALFMRVTHYCFDGYSISLAANRLATYYSAYENNEQLQEVDNKYSIRNFITENIEYKKSKKYYENKKYWKKEISIHKIESPIPRRRICSRAKATEILIKEELYDTISQLSIKSRLPISFILISLIGYTIYDLTKCKNFVVSPFHHGRMKYSYGNIIGCMSYSLFHFFNIDEDGERLNNIKENYIEYLDNLMHSEVSTVDLFKCGIGKELKKLGSDYLAVLLSILDVNGSDIDNTKYDYRVLYDLQNRMNQIYVSAVHEQNKCIHMTVLYQEKLFSDEKIFSIEKAFLDNIKKLSQ